MRNSRFWKEENQGGMVFLSRTTWSLLSIKHVPMEVEVLFSVKDLFCIPFHAFFLIHVTQKNKKTTHKNDPFGEEDEGTLNFFSLSLSNA